MVTGELNSAAGLDRHQGDGSPSIDLTSRTSAARAHDFWVGSACRVPPRARFVVPGYRARIHLSVGAESWRNSRFSAIAKQKELR